MSVSVVPLSAAGLRAWPAPVALRACRLLLLLRERDRERERKSKSKRSERARCPASLLGVRAVGRSSRSLSDRICKLDVERFPWRRRCVCGGLREMQRASASSPTITATITVRVMSGEARLLWFPVRSGTN
ncbi:hypothetical protein BV898_13107 [Hypsibius exemplaris]|uniref:Uncharacterized protein n=1 Tax=Hypsibius exemplaris TaxID=2072580 RepID=A0A1W0WBS0_HYPEX|nr:hypothetical protein BV898_13107 [Hypsibius exemplaris]